MPSIGRVFRLLATDYYFWSWMDLLLGGMPGSQADHMAMPLPALSCIPIVQTVTFLVKTLMPNQTRAPHLQMVHWWQLPDQSK